MEELIEKFYNGLSNLDAEEMGSCYHEDIVFRDPAFGVLRGRDVTAMWSMLCESQKGKNFRVDFHDVKCSGNSGNAICEAKYIFSPTGKPVHNIIHSSFEFSEGKIIKQFDEFSLYKWSRQAMGMTGFLIGWTAYFRNKFQQRSNAMLRKYISSKQENQ